jgi:hypothetical protein
MGEKAEVTVAPKGGIVPQVAYITNVLTKIKEDFLAVNAGLDFDFVRMGTWLTVSKKGHFIEKDPNSGDILEDYGDALDVVIALGEKRWSLWGHKDSAEDGQLIVASHDQDKAIEEFRAWSAENPEAAEQYDESEIKLRYMAYVVPVDTLTTTDAEGKQIPNDFPKVYLVSLSPTATISFGRWAMDRVFQGKYADRDIPKGTGVSSIVTRIFTAEESRGNNEWVGVRFDAVGMFVPAEYGLTV